MGPTLAHLAQICVPDIFFRGFYLYSMLDIVASYHRIQFQGKLMIHAEENDKKYHFGLDLGPLGPNSGRHSFFIKLVVRHCSELSFYAIYSKTYENSEKLNIGPDFGPFGPYLGPPNFFRGFYLY